MDHPLSAARAGVRAAEKALRLAEDQVVSELDPADVALAERMHASGCKQDHTTTCTWEWETHFHATQGKPIDWTKGPRRVWLLRARMAREEASMAAGAQD